MSKFDIHEVIYKGEVISYLNRNLIKQQGISPTSIEAIKAFHILKEATLERMDTEEDHTKLRKLASNITQIEFNLQELWKFKKDKSYHKSWELPKCTCPRMDNNDRYPHGPYIINFGCILHGQESLCDRQEFNLKY